MLAEYPKFVRQLKAKVHVFAPVDESRGGVTSGKTNIKYSPRRVQFGVSMNSMPAPAAKPECQPLSADQATAASGATWYASGSEIARVDGGVRRRGGRRGGATSNQTMPKTSTRLTASNGTAPITR